MFESRIPVAALVIGGTLALVLAACGGGSATPSPPSATVPFAIEVAASATPEAATATATSPTASPTATSQASATPAEATPVARAVNYADLTYTITDVIVSQETPRSYGNPRAEEIVDGSYLYVHLSVRNELRNVALVFDSTLFHLRLGETKTPSQWVRSQPAALSVQPGAVVSYITGFPLAADIVPDTAALVLLEPGKVEAAVALSGPIVPSQYPDAVQIETGPTLIPAANGCHVTIEPLSAALNLDAGLDLPGIAGSVEAGRRAAIGERFLRIELRATSDSNPCGGATVQGDLFRLEVDGASSLPANFVSRSVKVGEPQTVTLLFRVPVGGQDLTLHAATAAVWSLKVPDFGP